MEDGFDIVPVRIEDERAVVPRVVVRAKARCAEVLPARSDGGGMEGFDLTTARRGERDVRRRDQREMFLALK